MNRIGRVCTELYHHHQQQVEEAEQSELRKRRRHRQEQLVALKPELFGAGTGVDLNPEKEHTLDPLSTKREQQLDAQMVSLATHTIV